MASSRPNFLTSFSRSQVSSFAATLVDFAILFFLTELCSVWYVVSVAIGAFAGAVTNFLINRHWSFEAAHGRLDRQAVRYFWISGMSLLLNTLGVYVITEGFKIHYSLSVIVVSLAVGWLFNYPMHRGFVFR